MNNDNTTEIAVTTAYLTQGVLNDNNVVLNWGQGEIELVYELITLAYACERAYIREVANKELETHSMYQYELVACFAADYIVNHINDKNEMPDLDTFEIWFSELLKRDCG